MKIDNISHLTPSKAVSEGNGKDRTAGTAGDTTGKEAFDTGRLHSFTTDSSRDIDLARVQEIRQAIAEGRLEIRADRIADGLIDSVRAFLKQDSQ
ncbi:flagellar biosynthesis anti-sigma factor FlgM [Microbulbifer sp.]|uniref:flagellar biosynthesis anti-sigma factor FlgM n=1 Tax=Microbulbifer sp. TaxID=1908541 RepID=UPI003F37CEE1